VKENFVPKRQELIANAAEQPLNCLQSHHNPQQLGKGHREEMHF